MKKEDALALRERLRGLAGPVAARLGLPLAEDGKLYHDELADGTARWAARWTLAGRWPHAGAGAAGGACPGLRLEVWFFPGKGEGEVLLAALCAGAPHLETFQAHMAPAFTELVEGGRYARRYRVPEPLVSRFHPGTVGVCRRMPADPPAKLEAAFSQFVEEAAKALDSRFASFEGQADLAERFLAACQTTDPFALLRQRFGG